MNAASINIKEILLSDIIIFALLYVIPTFSHLMSFPLYLLDPMRIAVLGSVIFLPNKKNAFFLAATLPLFSYFVGGHPILLKSILISLELTFNLVFLFGFENRIGHRFEVVFLSIMLSKLFYYVIKYGIISVGLLKGDLFAIDLRWQLGVAAILSFFYWSVERRKAI